MKGYLLDTDICVFYLRDKHNIKQRLEETGRKKVFISDITVAELRYGAYKSDFPEENLKLVDAFLDEVNIVPFADGIDEFAKEKTLLCKAGKMVQDFDLLIAAAAKACNLTLVTNNTKHFERISDLQIENWVR